MKNSPEFTRAWVQLWPKLERFFIEEQKQFAIEFRGKHEQIGQYVEFMAVLTDKLKTIDDVVQAEVRKAPARPRLNNEQFKPKPTHA